MSKDTKDANAPLEGAPNFRDLGGYRTRDGRTVKAGRVFRSGSLDRLTPRDLARIAELEISMICDVRSPQERAEAPNQWRQKLGIDEIVIDTSAELKHANQGMLEKLRSEPTAERAREMMLLVYRSMPMAFAGKLHALAEHLAGPGGGPLIVHCTAGKDRTGFICAMLLLALDVPRETVYQDYLLSAHPERSRSLREQSHFAMELAFGKPPDPAVVDALIGVYPEYLDISIGSVIDEFGSVERYLEEAAGLDPDRRQILRHSLLI